MALPPIVAIEIGTTRTVVMVGETNENDRVRILGAGIAASTGVRKSEVINLANARRGVVEAVRRAEDAADVDIREVLLGFSGGQIKATAHEGRAPVRGRNRVVAREDVDEVMDLAHSVNLPEDRVILHTICQNFTLDDQPNIVRPEGMQGATLKVDALVVHTARNRLDNAVNVLKALPLRVSDVAFSGLTAALAVLSPEQKRSGVLSIDMGGGTTKYVVYAGGVLAAAGTLAIGGDHVTNDIALAFNIPLAAAERLKREEGSARLGGDSDRGRIKVPSSVGFAERSLNPKSLRTVINARVDEILRCVRAEVNRRGLLHHISAGVRLSGGGARLHGTAELAEHVFGLPAGIAAPENVDGLEDRYGDPVELASAAGLVLYGFKTYRETGLLAPLRDWFKGVLGR